MNGDEVRLPQQFLQRQQRHAQLGGAGRLHIRVVSDQPHAERAQPLGHEQADAAQAHDTHGLVREFHTGVLAAFPLSVYQRLVRRGNVARAGQQQRNCEFRGRHDVRGGRVDHHDPGLGSGIDVDVVQAHAGASDHLEPASSSQRLGIDLRGRTHKDRVHVRDGGQQLRAVGAVGLADLEVRAQRFKGGWRQFLGDQDDGFAHP